MTRVAAGPPVTVAPALETTLEWTVVWIDSREAIVGRLGGGAPIVEHLLSDVPVHHRSTGAVRHAAAVQSGGGPPRSAGEDHRLEHVRRFLRVVQLRLPANDGLLILGPGSMAGRLGGVVRMEDRRHLRSRPIVYRRADHLTDAQIVAELRQVAGQPAPRRAVGAYRWSGPQPQTSSGTDRPPRRVRGRSRRAVEEDDWRMADEGEIG